MILEAGVAISARPEDVFDFFSRMEENYLRWHPGHISFRWEGEGGLREGVVFSFEERIAGKRLSKRVRFTRIEPGRLIAFAPVNPLMRLVLPRISFAIAPDRAGIRVTQTIPVRTGPIGAWLNRREFDAVQVHMREEGENLKRILESSARQGRMP